MSIAQIKFPLDAAPRLVLQLAAAKEVIDPRPLGGTNAKWELQVSK